jgi:hypothetical protein
MQQREIVAMRKIKLLIGIVAFGIGLAASAPADSWLVVNFRLKAILQGPATTIGHNYVAKPTTPVKITTKDILNLIAENNSHPDGYYDGDLLVQDQRLQDFFVYSGDPNAGGINLLSIDYGLMGTSVYTRVESDVDNLVNGSYNYNWRYITDIHLNDFSYANAGNVIFFYGTSNRTIKHLGSDPLNITDSLKAQGFADGTLGHTSFYATGTETGAGKHP